MGRTHPDRHGLGVGNAQHPLHMAGSGLSVFGIHQHIDMRRPQPGQVMGCRIEGGDHIDADPNFFEQRLDLFDVIAVAKDEAVELVDAQRPEAPGAVLRERVRELGRIAEIYGNAAVQEAAAVAAPEADRIARDGLSNEERKVYRAESAQVKSQQGNASR